MAKYAPLKFIEHSDEYRKEHKIEKSWDFLENITGNKICLTEEELFNLVLSSKFMTFGYRGPRRDVNNILLDRDCVAMLEKMIGMKASEESFVTDIRDFLVMQNILDIWAQNKQVYKLDRDFAGILIKTDKLKLYKDVLEHLPYDTFYIDLSEAGIKNCEGEFVHIHKYGEEYAIVVYLLTSQQIVFSHYSFHLFFNDDFTEIERPKDFVCRCDTLLEDAEEVLKRGSVIDVKNEYEEIDRVTTSMIAFQLLTYIGSSEPDIEESPVSKSTYNPKITEKTSFKSVKTWDVGVRYGTSLRIFKKNLKKEKRELENKEQTSENKKVRNAPRPHMRCAHWQRYHVGEGRTNTIVKWIPPVMVLGSQEMPLTIHKVG